MFDCYFLPVSNCSARADVLSKLPGAPPFRVNDPAPVMVANASLYGRFKRTLVPSALDELLQCSGIPRKFFYYWWRAQCVAYFVRYNAQTARALAVLRGKHFPRRLPPGSISMHVRRGDKGTEMKFLDNAEFVKAVGRVLSLDPGTRASVFVSTEDDAVLRYMEAARKFEVLYANVTRHSSTIAVVDFAKRIGGENEMLLSLLNLELALECDAFIGRLASNWCRLIEELRSTQRCKADKVYIDPAQWPRITDVFW